MEPGPERVAQFSLGALLGLAGLGRGQSSPGTPTPGWVPHLEVGEVLLHEAVDLTHRQAASLAVL